MSVRVRHIVEVDFLRETPEVAGQRGWAEGSIVSVVVEKFPGPEQHGILLTIEGTTYLLRAPVVEALYDVYQGEPLEGAEVVFS